MGATPKQVVVIAGPTGSGESTITNEIVRRYSNRVKRLVTATTRPPRGSERNGIDYYFFSKGDFLEKEKSGEILESTYIKNRDVFYGTYAPDLEQKIKSGYIVIVNPDIVGTNYYKNNYDATTIFIRPDSLDIVERRIRDRNPDLSEEEIKQRRINAELEIKNEGPFYSYQVENADGKLEKAVTEVIAILKKEGYTLE